MNAAHDEHRRGDLVSLRLFGVVSGFFDRFAGRLGVLAKTLNRVAGRSSGREYKGKSRESEFHEYLHKSHRQIAD
jgi:hypothetical protein